MTFVSPRGWSGSSPFACADEPRHRLGDLLGSADRGQLVIVVQDAHRHPWQESAVEDLLASAPDAIVVEIGVPVWRPEPAAGYVATHGVGRVNLEAAAERLLARAQHVDKGK